MIKGVMVKSYSFLKKFVLTLLLFEICRLPRFILGVQYDTENLKFKHFYKPYFRTLNRLQKFVKLCNFQSCSWKYILICMIKHSGQNLQTSWISLRCLDKSGTFILHFQVRCMLFNKKKKLTRNFIFFFLIFKYTVNLN